MGAVTTSVGAAPVAAAADGEQARLRRRYDRERRARTEAEAITERATRDLYGVIAELEQFKAILDATPDFVVVFGVDGRVRYLNEVARRAVASDDEARPVTIGDLYTPWAAARLQHEALPALRRDGVWRGDLEVRDATSDHGVPVSQVLLLHQAATGTAAYFSAIARDVTEEQDLQRQLAHQALHDPLTGLPNRLLFAERVGHSVASGDTGAASVAVLFIDLDDFKTVNDSLGHAVGDELLVAVARRVDGCLRTGDTAARLGGDEFAVLLRGVQHVDEAVRVAERILERLAEPFEIGGRAVQVSGSIGIAVGRTGTGDADVLLRSADVAMYLAKDGGKNRCTVFEDHMYDGVIERLELKADLQLACDRGEFTLHYQPIVTLDDGVITGFEALLRWQHPTRGLVAPGEFVALLEETGLIVGVGRWVLAQACQQVRRWQDRHPGGAPLTMSVNLAAREVQTPGLVEDVAQCLRASGIEPASLTLELTESTLVDDTAGAARVLHELKALGVRLAIDDFGTGYSSLSYLQAFPIDVIKIDRSFVDAITRDQSDLALVRTIHDLADALHVGTVAEGIEQLSQAQALQELGCLQGQGYYYARPLDEADVTRLLREHAGAAPPTQTADG